jgi:hypothetical protein
VIEVDLGPPVLFVAAFAFGSIPSAMDILNLVAIDARCADSFIAFADMARGARDIAVRTLQPKFGLVMIKRLHVTPCGFAMTIIAGVAQTPFMRIICLMTIEAALGGIAELYILCVTAVALHCLVTVPKLEIRGCVIECLAVKQDDIGIAPFVIAMTMGAFLFRCIGFTPMKSRRHLTIGGNFFVAC